MLFAVKSSWFDQAELLMQVGADVSKTEDLRNPTPQQSC